MMMMMEMRLVHITQHSIRCVCNVRLIIITHLFDCRFGQGFVGRQSPSEASAYGYPRDGK